MKRAKGVLLYSGGLDSLLAAKILMDQGIDLVGFHCILPFFSRKEDPENYQSAKFAKQIDLPLEFYHCGKEYIEMLRNPSHGYGKNMNPCIDCKIFFIKKAARFMETINADFVATGEVVGQRPMSQLKHTLNHIEKESGLKGRLLRPLSAKILKPTLAEEQGLINREMLFDINGRSRKVQMQLAEKYNLADYSSPAGGCLFTDPSISGRVRDLLQYHADCDENDFYLLTIGRHFRISDRAKIIIARNHAENLELEKFQENADYYIVPDYKGPVASVKGYLSEDDIILSGEIMCRYGKSDGIKNSIMINMTNCVVKKVEINNRISDQVLDKMRI